MKREKKNTWSSQTPK